MATDITVTGQPNKPALINHERLISLQRSLNLSAADIYSGDSQDEFIVSCAGDRYLKHLLGKGTSGLLVGPDGVGKASAASFISCQDDAPEFDLLLPQSTSELYQDLWGTLRSTHPPVRSVVRMVGHYWRCQRCKRQCHVGAPLEYVIDPLSDDDLRDTMRMTDGDCALLRTEVDSQVHNLSGIIIIEVPKPFDKSLVSLLERLLSYTRIIFLVDDDQKDELQKHTAFSSLPTWKAQRPSLNVMMDALAKRLGPGNRPVSEMGLILLAYLSGGLIGKFLTLVDTVIDHIVLEERTYQVGPEYVLSVIGETLDGHSMILACLPQVQGKWFSPTELARVMNQLFSCKFSAETVGKLLADMPLQFRKGHNRREYYFDVTRLTRDNSALADGFTKISGGCGGFLALSSGERVAHSGDALYRLKH